MKNNICSFIIIICALLNFLESKINAWEVVSADDDFIYVKVNKNDLEGIYKHKLMVRAICRVNRVDEKNFWLQNFIKIPLNFEKGIQWSPLPQRYLEAEQYEKYILISIKNQFLGAYERGNLKMHFPISSGTEKHPTPIGKFKIFAKEVNHKSSLYKDKKGRPIKMPWAIAFHIGFYNGQWIVTWIHGGELPGYPASHGCVRLFEEDAKILFLWLFPNNKNENYEYVKNGTPVEVNVN